MSLEWRQGDAVRGEELTGCCSCHAAPPCSYCERRVYVIVNPDGLFYGVCSGGYTPEFELAMKFGHPDEALGFPDKIVAYDGG